MITNSKLGLIELTYELEKLGTKKQVEFTRFLLQIAQEKFNCKLVGLSLWTKSFRDSAGWIRCFGAERAPGNLFANGKSCEITVAQNKTEIYTGKHKWPTAWNIVHYLEGYYKNPDIGRGCGNTGQHTLNSKYIIPGIYKVINGQWIKIK
jgi:hypothetical protein